MKKINIPCIGYSVAADLYENNNKEILLVLIGFRSTKESSRDLVNAVVTQAKTDALVIEYSGRGESPFPIDDITCAQNFLEAITAFDWLTQKYPNKKINVMGGSFGGFLAVQLTKYRQFSKLILRVPAIYPPDQFYTKFSDLDIKANRKYRQSEKNLEQHPLLKRAQRFGGKTLVITHELDVICPRNTTNAFVKAFNAETWEAKGFEHSVGASKITRQQIENYQKRISSWLKSGNL